LSELTSSLCADFAIRMMRAIAVHRATGNGAEVEEGLNLLDAYRCAWRGERSDEEKAIAATRAIERIAAWSNGEASPVPSPTPKLKECLNST
jgi:hypothetical protein